MQLIIIFVKQRFNMGVITIDVSARENMPPDSSGWFRVDIPNGSTHTFSVSAFTNTNPPYSDPENDPLDQVKIVTLPSRGFIKKNGSNISLNEVITVAELNNNELVYEPESDPDGYIDNNATFVVADSGSGVFTISPKQMYLSLEYSDVTNNQPPDNVGNGEKELFEGSSFVFTRDSLTTELNGPYSDPENNPAYKLLIISLPSSGQILLDGVEVSLGQEILFTDIDNGDLIYQNNEYPKGGVDGFEFQISDTVSQQYTG